LFRARLGVKVTRIAGADKYGKYDKAANFPKEMEKYAPQLE